MLGRPVPQPSLKPPAASAKPPTVRLEGNAFALATLAFLVVVSLLAFACRALPKLESPDPIQTYIWSGIVLLLALMFGVLFGYQHALRRSTALNLAGVFALLGIWASLGLGQAAFGRGLDPILLQGVMLLALAGLVLFGLRGQLQGASREVTEAIAITEVDPLTGLMTREALLKRHDRLERTSTNALLVIDLNELKTINESKGQATGDALLRQLGNEINKRLEDRGNRIGYAARWRDDEFVVLLPDRAERMATEFATRLQSVVVGPRSNMPAFAFGTAPVRGGRPLDRAMALANDRMHQTKRAQREAEALITGSAEITSFQEFTARLEELREPEEITRSGLQMACQLVGFDVGQCIQREENNDLFVLRQLEGRKGKLEPGMEDLVGKAVFRGGKGLVGRAIADGNVHYASDYADDAAARDDNNFHSIKSMIAVPVKHRGEVLAVLTLFTTRTWEPITPMVRRVVEAIASQLAHAIELDYRIEEVRLTLEESMLISGLALEGRDLETAGHTQRVVRFATQIGRSMGLRGDKLNELRQGAYLHDIGKLAIPDAILLKKGKLDANEWVIMRSHTVLGFDLAKRIPTLPRGSLEVIRSHHERWDGGGYPDGTIGIGIPLGARIFAACDIYDALTSERPYKKAWSEAEAIAELRKISGSHLDPKVVDVFINKVLDKAALEVG